MKRGAIMCAASHSVPRVSVQRNLFVRPSPGRWPWLPAAALAAFLGASSPASAWITLAEGEKGKLEVEARLQLAGVVLGREFYGPDQQEERIQDFFIRRGRIALQGKPSEKLSLQFMMGQDNVNARIPAITGSTRLPTEDSGFKIKDFFVNYRFTDGFQVTGGMFKIPFLRQSLESAHQQTLVERSVLTAIRPSREGSRDVGGQVWGNLGGFQYRAALFDGSDQEDASTSSSLRGTARVSYNWFTKETGFGYAGVPFGQKKTLQIGGQIDFQGDRLDPRDETTALAAQPRDYRNWAADVYCEQPLGEQSALAFEAAYLDRRDDYIDSTLEEWRRDGYFGQISFLLPGKVGPGRLLLAGRAERLDSERGTATSKLTGRTAGISWLYKDKGNKVQLDYTDLREDPDELDNNQIRLSIWLVY
jgi:hypothetical protein